MAQKGSHAHSKYSSPFQLLNMFKKSKDFTNDGITYYLFVDGGEFAKEGESIISNISTFVIYSMGPDGLQHVHHDTVIHERSDIQYYEIHSISKGLSFIQSHVQKNKIKEKVTISVFMNTKPYFNALGSWIYEWFVRDKEEKLKTKMLTNITTDLLAVVFNILMSLGEKNIHTKFFRVDNYQGEHKMLRLKKEFEKANRCKLDLPQFALIYSGMSECSIRIDDAYRLSQIGTQLEDLELTHRTHNILKRAGLDTVEKLKSISLEGLMQSTRNLSRKGLVELAKKLDRPELLNDTRDIEN